MKTSQLLNVFALATLAIAGVTYADETSKEGYLIDSRGDVVRSGAGLCVHTGYWTPAMAIEECDPVAKQPDAPVIAKEAPPVITKKPAYVPYAMQTETLFAYNKSDISEAGKQKMNDEIIGKMKEDPKDEVVVITGHADRIGSDEYNMKLSQRRADAVKAYLVEQGIDGNRIETVARGEAEPVVSCNHIRGKATRKNKALIACLQPNRRIVLDLKGQMPAPQ
ncbi:MAG: OmpA family protein [Gallionella sp.]|jgi:OOP family OmpA-OmpF porin